MDYSPLALVISGLIRSISGWYTQSIEDGKIDNFEWNKLGQTIVRIGVLGLVIAYFPGLDLSFVEASVVALGGDIFMSFVKKLKSK